MWLFVSSCVYEIPRLLSLLVLASIASKDERDIPSLGFLHQLCCIKCSPTLTVILVLAYVCCTIVCWVCLCPRLPVAVGKRDSWLEDPV